MDGLRAQLIELRSRLKEAGIDLDTLPPFSVTQDEALSVLRQFYNNPDTLPIGANCIISGFQCYVRADEKLLNPQENQP